MKKSNKNMNLKCNITVKSMTSGEYQKKRSCALNVLASIK